MFIDSEKVISTQGREPPFITTKKELKKYAAREEQKKLIAQGWRRTEEDWTKKESQSCQYLIGDQIIRNY